LIRRFPEFVCPGDELLLESDDAYEVFKIDESLSPQKSKALANLDSFLEEHSGKPFERMYLAKDGLNEPEWNEIRSLTEKVLAAVQMDKNCSIIKERSRFLCER